jgi:hypothetical protein
MTSEAIDIYQAYLDVSTRLVLTGESEAYADHVQLPFVFRTARGVEIIETRADLITDMQKVYDWLASHTCRTTTASHARRGFSTRTRSKASM